MQSPSVLLLAGRQKEHPNKGLLNNTALAVCEG